MSNAFVGAVTTSTDIPPVLMIVGLVWLALAVPVGIACGVLRRRSIVGPERIGKSESGWVLVYIFFTGLCAAIVVGSGVSILCKAAKFETDLTVLIGGIAMEGTAFLSLMVISGLLRPAGVEQLGMRPWRLPRGVLLGFATLFVLYPVVMAISAATTIIFQWAGWPEPKPNEVLEFVTGSNQRAIVVLGIFMAVVIAPFCEELVFRGFLQTVLSRFFNWFQQSPLQESEPKTRAAARWAAVVITAACFALVHREWAFMPPLFVLAVGLGYVYERTGNLWGTIVAHSVFNGLQIILALKLGMN